MSQISSKKLFIFDMDGTVYLGERVFPQAVSFIARLRREGRRVLFFTNNASHDHTFYLSRLSRMGFDATEGELLTSGDVTSAFLASKRAGRGVYLVGTPELCRQFTAAGVRLMSRDEALNSDARQICVVTSFDTTLTYEKLDTACRLIRGGAEYLSTHPDINCPTEYGFAPDSGAISALVTASTGVTPRYFGKPYPETAEMISAVSGVSRDDMVVFGDRLYTDIAFGRRSGVTAALVMTGETDAAALAAAGGETAPDIVFADMREAETATFGG